MVHHHYLVVAYPSQGNINPTLQFAKRLTRMGAQVTFGTSMSAHRRMPNTPTPHGLTFAPFSDGHDDAIKFTDDFLSEFKHRNSQAITDLILALANGCRPVTCLIYNHLLPWAADVARNLHISSTLLWVQPAAVFDIYYHYFNGCRDIIASHVNDPSYSIKLPGLPLLNCRDLPSFLVPTNPVLTNTHNTILRIYEQVFQTLGRETKPQVLVNTFDALEAEAIKAVDKINLIGIGPLIPSAFLDGKDSSDTSFGGDLFLGSRNYVEWLNSKTQSSVVYVSFGSLGMVSKQQMEEIARGLLESHRPFLWVILPQLETGVEEKEENMILNNMEELKRQGMIVPWCSQLEVLCHPSVGCFVTHCGWNSTLESLVAGVPTVMLPQWADQGMNAKLVEDVWRTGVRLRTNEERKGIVESKELSRCLEIVMGGESGEEMRRNAKKWKDLAREAVMEGGSSERNILAFVEEQVYDSKVFVG